MGVPSTGRKRRRTTRTFTVVVILLWAAAAALAGYMIWHTQFAAGAAASPSTTTSSPADTTTEAPTTTTTLPPDLSVAAGGDVIGDRGVGTFLDKNGGAALFAGVKAYMEPAQLAFVNIEGAISDQGTRNTFKEYTFRARPALLDGLVSADINIVSLANNHSLDYRWKALSDCISRLDAAGVKHAGAGGDLSAASAPTILETPAGKVAFIAASEIAESFAALKDRAGTNYTSAPNAALLADVAAAAKQADFVVVSMHWGKEYTPTANSHQISLAHKLIEAGADLILGHHPHVIQAMEIYKNRLIVYSMGDLVLDWHSPYAGETFVLQVTVPKDGPPSGRIIPVYLSRINGTPKVVTGTIAARILARLTKLSTARGLELNRDGDIATFGSPGDEFAPTTSTTAPPASTTTSVAPTTTSAAPGSTTTTTTIP
jgi:hypothetical protein